MTESKPLAGKTALVTGSSKGIGADTARALAAAGAHVVITGRDVKALEAVEDAIHAEGGTATIAPVDLTETDGIARLASALSGRWDTLDILVLSAAYLPSLGPVTQIDGKEWSRAITVNLLATQALIASFDPLLKRAAAGRVIGLTTSVAAAPRAYWGAYAATKAGFENLLDSYGQEVAAISPVRVAIIDPGATRTQMRARAYPGEDPKTVKEPAVVANRILALLSEDFANGHRERIAG